MTNLNKIFLNTTNIQYFYFFTHPALMDGTATQWRISFITNICKEVFYVLPFCIDCCTFDALWKI